jgi:hypothetical protein
MMFLWIPTGSPLEGLLVIRTLGETETAVSSADQPFGANMAFRMAIQKICRFDAHLGRTGTTAILGEETAVFRRLRKEGHRGLWVPAARVAHYVTAERMSVKYVWNYFHGAGQTEIRLGERLRGRRLWGAPRWLYKKYWLSRAQSCLCRLMRHPAWARAYTRAAVLAGMIDESRHLGESSCQV